MFNAFLHSFRYSRRVIAWYLLFSLGGIVALGIGVLWAGHIAVNNWREDARLTHLGLSLIHI